MVIILVNKSSYNNHEQSGAITKDIVDHMVD